MNRTTLLALAGGLIAGLIAGYFIGAGSASGTSVVVAAGIPTSPVPQPEAMPNPGMGAPGMAAPPTAEQQQHLAALERTVLQDPKNRAAWVELGNTYFDTHQPQKAVVAYTRALALQGDDPNVLTDQGVMYRELGQYDKAVANFQKANKLDPKHLQSLFNLGIVYANDLHKPAEATAAWNRLIALDPTSQQADQARQAMAQLKGPAIH